MTLTTWRALPTTSAVLYKDDCCKHPKTRWSALFCEGFSVPVQQNNSNLCDKQILWEDTSVMRFVKGHRKGQKKARFRNVGLAWFSQLCDSSPGSLNSMWLTKLCLEVILDRCPIWCQSATWVRIFVKAIKHCRKQLFFKTRASV